MKVNLTIITLLFFIYSCSNNMRKPESFSDKMQRYHANQYSDNKVPQLEFPKHTFQKQSRKPASIKPQKKKNLNISNKRLYFLTLHSQYTSLNELSGSIAPQVTICPNFHSSLTQVKKAQWKNQSKKAIDLSKVNYKNKKGYIPELDLPITRNSKKPTVKDVIEKEGSEIVSKAIQLHLTKTYSELQELCEFGNSDNYYTFENLYTLIQMGKVSGDQEKLSALLKTTLFTNEIIIESLKKHQLKRNRAPASKSHDNALIKEMFLRFKSPISHSDLATLYR